MNRKESIETMQRLFRWLERRYGGNLPFDNYSGRKDAVVIRDKVLHHEDLERLMTHDILALRIRQFYDRTVASSLGSELSSSSHRSINWKISTSQGLEMSDVSTLGSHLPYNVATASGQIEDYFQGVRKEFQNRRQPSQPLWPVDKLRLELDEAWKQGAGLARDKVTGRSMGAGLVRIMEGPTRWKKGYIHVDEMAPLNTSNGLFSANIYLQMPKSNDDDETSTTKTTTITSSPAIDIWPLSIRNRWDWYRNAILLSGLSSQDAEAQVRLRHELGVPYRIEAEPGDLILLCVQRPHAAIGFQDGIRVSLQSFIQFNGLNQRLIIES